MKKAEPAERPEAYVESLDGRRLDFVGAAQLANVMIFINESIVSLVSRYNNFYSIA